MISKDEFINWKAGEVTKAVFKMLRDGRDDLSYSLINGNTLKGDSSTAEATARVVGILYGIDLILEMKVEDKEEVDEESEQD